jgi:hypothetical protein
VPEGASQSVIELQASLASACEPTGLDRLVWIAPGTVATDERQARILAELRSGKGLSRQSDLYEVTLEDFKSAIRHRLDVIAHPAPSAAPAPPRGAARIYLVCDQLDRDAAAPIVDTLFARGYDVTLPFFGGNETEVREDHEENLRLCDAVLIYHGAGTEFWLRGKLRDLARIAGLGRTAPFRAVGIYAATSTPQLASFRTHDVLVMTESGPFSASTLTPFEVLLGAQLNGAGEN